MAEQEIWQQSRVSKDRKYHETIKGPFYVNRFQEVLSFHPPGLAVAKQNNRWFHIKPDGTPMCSKSFDHAFGFYENRASVEEAGEWYHIVINGEQAYKRRFAWCGNFQEGLCVVREKNGFFHHIKLDGEDAYSKKYLYCGDFKEGNAAVQKNDGRWIHIQTDGRQLNDQSFKELGTFHKGFATAKDQFGWFHVDKLGKALYNQRYQLTEPFYNELAFCIKMNGKTIRINTKGDEIEQLSPKETKREGKKILLIGNLSSGKTALAHKLQNHLNFSTYGIDDCRIKISDGSMTGELQAWSKFIEFCESQEETILEFSGAGPNVHSVARALELSGFKIYVIFLDVTPEECLVISEKRKFTAPYPYPIRNPKELILYVDREVTIAWNNVWTKKGFKTLRITNDRKNALEKSITFLGETYEL